MQFKIVENGVDFGLNLTEVLLPILLKKYGNYKSYAIGKWHIGHYSPDFLPTARGFDDYFGYFSGKVYPWSKKVKVSGTYYYDMISMNESCYSSFTSKSVKTYSTELFTDKALSFIEDHDFESNPMFLYMAYQNVHNPFKDVSIRHSGIAESDHYINDDLYEHLSDTIPGSNRLQYAISLNLLDSAVESIYKMIDLKSQLDNTYSLSQVIMEVVIVQGGEMGICEVQKAHCLKEE
jgi:arylsulfatase A-like enzyme